jgi:hypothetical protein
MRDVASRCLLRVVFMLCVSWHASESANDCRKGGLFTSSRARLEWPVSGKSLFGAFHSIDPQGRSSLGRRGELLRTR